MSKLQYRGNINMKDGVFHVGLSLVEFKEDDVVIIYSPALDLSGYGYNVEEAKQSFHVALNEFFRYTNNKKTFNAVMKKLGWSIKGGRLNPKIEPPLNSDLVASNPLYNEIINSKDYKVYNEDVELVL